MGKVQELRKNKRRYTKSGKKSIFAGLLECADCGAKLYFCTSRAHKKDHDYFVCSNYKGNTGICTVRYIRENAIYDVVLEQVDNVEYFLNIVRQYTEIKGLSARVVNDLIDKIKVHAVDKSSGQRIQRIDIYYTAVGLIDISQHIGELA